MIKVFFRVLYVMSPTIVLFIFLTVYPWYDEQRSLTRYIRKEKKRISNIRIEDCVIDDNYTDKQYGIARHKYTNEHIPIKKTDGKWIINKT